MSVVLGIHDGHHSNASIFVDNKLVAAFAEERLTRKKSEYGYPEESIKHCLKVASLTKSDIDIVALSSIDLPPKYHIVKRSTTFSIEDFWKEQTLYWYPKIYQNKKPSYLEIFNDKKADVNSPYDYSFVENEDDTRGMLGSRKDLIKRDLGITQDNIHVFEHQSCHAYYGYYWYGGNDDNFLVMTADGFGDGANGSIWIGRRGEPLKEIKRTNKCNIGRIYRYITLLLGMKPNEHEYKVMGLAPYANKKYAEKSYDIFSSTIQVDNLDFTYREKIKDHFWYFKSKLEGHRFDCIAYGLQKMTEDLLAKWVSNAVHETKINNVVLSGGVSLNVKANKEIWGLDDVQSLFVPPGASDESLSVGAAFRFLVENNHSSGVFDCEPKTDLYLGNCYDDEHIEKVLGDNKDLFVKRVGPKDIAELLVQEKVIARFSGRMELGPRALGNRSILADPRNRDVVAIINDMVKMRDFWMPFCPSILEDRMNDYIKNPKKINGNYMTIAFDSTELGKKDIPAALHPSDMTARPQIVNSQTNEGYYQIIKEFEKITGVGCLLNTSFNLHGEPIVETPEDALDTMRRSGLKHIVLNNLLVSKES
jgi:carbamoyltransferase